FSFGSSSGFFTGGFGSTNAPSSSSHGTSNSGGWSHHGASAFSFPSQWESAPLPSLFPELDDLEQDWSDDDPD
ncbi:hypothetical protein, partial [Klebsiella pneumoniae]